MVGVVSEVHPIARRQTAIDVAKRCQERAVEGPVRVLTVLADVYDSRGLRASMAEICGAGFTRRCPNGHLVRRMFRRSGVPIPPPRRQSGPENSHRCTVDFLVVIRYDKQMPDLSPTLKRVLESAALLQRVVPDAVLVGGSAAAVHAGHRDSFDHDHVLADLVERYEAVLEAVEATEGWATSVRASKPPFTIMGSLWGVEAGLRQLRRSRPLETCEVRVGDEAVVVAPTAAEALRVKAFLVVQRNVVRDYLDVVALSEHLGQDNAVEVLSGIDSFYSDRSGEEGSVLTSLVMALADPNPRDQDVIEELPRYKGLDERYHRWGDVVEICQSLALRLSGAA